LSTVGTQKVFRHSFVSASEGPEFGPRLALWVIFRCSFSRCFKYRLTVATPLSYRQKRYETRLKLHRLTEEEALRRIINWLKGSGTKSLDPVNYPSYGHELYVPNVISQCLHEVLNAERGKNPGVMRTYAMSAHQPEAAPFYDAVWTLCRNGILRSDPPNPNTNGTDSGQGFTVTSYGKKWLEEVSGYECIPAEYGRFSQLLSGHSDRFGDG